MDAQTNERMQSYIRGFRAGAASKAMDVRFTKNAKQHIAESYSEGYRDGKDRFNTAVSQYALRFGYNFSEAILRDMDE